MSGMHYLLISDPRAGDVGRLVYITKHKNTVSTLVALSRRVTSHNIFLLNDASETSTTSTSRHLPPMLRHAYQVQVARRSSFSPSRLQKLGSGRTPRDPPASCRPLFPQSRDANNRIGIGLRFAITSKKNRTAQQTAIRPAWPNPLMHIAGSSPAVAAEDRSIL